MLFQDYWKQWYSMSQGRVGRRALHFVSEDLGFPKHKDCSHQVWFKWPSTQEVLSMTIVNTKLWSIFQTSAKFYLIAKTGRKRHSSFPLCWLLSQALLTAITKEHGHGQPLEADSSNTHSQSQLHDQGCSTCLPAFHFPLLHPGDIGSCQQISSTLSQSAQSALCPFFLGSCLIPALLIGPPQLLPLSVSDL